MIDFSGQRRWTSFPCNIKPFQ